MIAKRQCNEIQVNSGGRLGRETKEEKKSERDDLEIQYEEKIEMN
jgi:hypothetical protein